MNLLFVVYRELNPGVGITKKIHAQCRALTENGYKVDLHYYKRLDNGDFNSYINEREYENYGKGRLAIRLKTILNRKNILQYIIDHKIEVVYIRYEFMADYAFLYFLRLLKQQKVSIVMEIPTYPYDDELKPKGFVSRLYNRIEKHCRKKMYKYVDRVLTYSDDEFIFKIPTIRVSNGIDFNKIPIKTSFPSSDNVNFIGVANLGFWHGYDRLIRGIKNYLDKDNTMPIHFHLVGNGDVAYKKELIELVDELALKDYVTFHGNMEGDELTMLFENTHLAIGSLGRHRSGITNLKSLKNVEYAARGIPFIYSENDANFDDKKYILKVSANESPINVDELISFYLSNKWDSNDIRGSIEQRLSWKTQMEKVVQSICEIGDSK